MSIFKKYKLDKYKNVKKKSQEIGILVVDDETPNLRVLNNLLKNDYKVFCAETSHDGLSLIQDKDNARQIHIIVADQRMPKMTGVEFLKETIKHLPLAVRIILTGYADMNDIIDAINKAHIYHYISKPIEPEDFLITIKRAAEIYLLEIQNYNLLKELQDLNLSLEEKVKTRTNELKNSNDLLRQYSEELQIEKKRLEEITITDELTQIYNRRYLFNRLPEEINRSIRYHNPLSVAMIDIDFFKKINDIFGHQKGDEVLHGIAQKSVKLLRKIDIVGRYGGEEFLVIMPETSQSNAYSVIKRVLREIEKLKWKPDALKTTISAGLTQYKENESMDDFLKRSDELLYKAKNNGRNRIERDGRNITAENAEM
jgi:diguanylate cyclase (GGDEF)-like protein